MLNFTTQSHIRCFFIPNEEAISNTFYGNVEVFYGVTSELVSEYENLRNCLSRDELSRAERFYFEEDKFTFVMSHALIRLIISKQLAIRLSDLSFEISDYGKPYLLGNAVYFNLTHTRDAFALVLSRDFPVGIDMESSDRNIDLESIIKTYFSRNENDFILKDKSFTRDRFFLLWTRKEALLKAIGTGLLENLHNIEVHSSNNPIEKAAFNSQSVETLFEEYFIYTIQPGIHYLSVAAPGKCDIVFNKIDCNRIIGYLD